MGHKNISGEKICCQHCGYCWLTNSQMAITSCPRCSYRVRLRPSTRVNIPAGNITNQQAEQTRYY